MDVLFTNTRVLYRVRQGFSEKNCLCCWHYQCTSLLAGFNNQHFSIVRIVVGGLFKGGEKTGHSRITSPDNSLLPSSLCVFTGSVLIQPDALVFLRSERHGDGQDEEGEGGGNQPLPNMLLLLSSWPANRLWRRARSRCVKATRLPLKRLAVYLTPYCRSCSRWIKCRVLLHCVSKSVFRLRIYCTEKWSYQCWHHISQTLLPWSNFVQVFCLIYSCIRLCCGLWHRLAVRQLPLSANRPRVPSINRNANWWKWHLLWGRGGACPVNQWVAAAQGTEQVVLVVCWRAHGQEVVFTRLSFFFMCGHWGGPVTFQCGLSQRSPPPSSSSSSLFDDTVSLSHTTGV